MDRVPIKLNFEGKELIGDAQPYPDSIKNGVPHKFNITINSVFIGPMECKEIGWRFEKEGLQGLADKIGDYLFKWYE